MLLSPALKAQELSGADTAWVLVSSVLVLLMTLPGVALFYGGMVRAKNVLSVFMQCLCIAALVSIFWSLLGHSLAFAQGGAGPWLGGLSQVFLVHVNTKALHGAIPEALWVFFQMTFAIITCALIIGAVVERMAFSALLLFTGLWVILAYAPVAHWVWGGGWLGGLGAIDFAGGTVVHINAGVAGLVAAIMVGPRQGWPHNPMIPHHLGDTFAGTALLWVGWMGFNGGSALAAGGSAALAVLVTQVAASAGVLSWVIIEWIWHRRPSLLGAASGAVAGLVAITPASGSVNPAGALAIGVVAGVACFFGATRLKRIFRYDDALDTFGVHAVGGIVGALLTGVFADPRLGGLGFGAGIASMGKQLAVQGLAVMATISWDVAATFAILTLVKRIVQIRVTPEEEELGLDLALHEERAYRLESEAKT